MQLLSFPEAATPPELRAQVRELHQEAWPAPESPADPAPEPPAGASAATGAGDSAGPHDNVRQGLGLHHDPALRPVSMLLVDEGTVLAALDILSKPIVHAGRRFLAGGLSTVVTRQAVRGRGHGRRLVAAAHQVMASADPGPTPDLRLDLDLRLNLDLRLDLGLFTCDRPLQGFYESAGWHVLPGAVLVGGTPQAPFPSDQPGFDKVTMADFFSPAARQARAAFRNTRLALYPGDIDKLW
ncbi:GNAT family N-acetyltransferase [Streptomyces sp. NPDC048506]|uniref:GNAT family N-acetyltransferase n=1 Tax=Streptomyces sp. NPDC048506 TaxID=3155028 RepID=UPI0034291139